MKRGSWVVGWIALAVLPLPALSQETGVIAAGTGWTGGVTEVDIMTPDDRLEVWVYEAYLSGRPENTVSDYGQMVCRTPCHLTLANGMYTFYVGRTELGIDALGTPQGWEVEDSSLGSLISGILLVALGSPVLLAGLIVLAIEDASDADLSELGWGLTIGGGASTLLGIPLLATWKGRVTPLAPRLVPVDAPAVGLVPSLAVFPGPAGSAGWGLQLAGTWPGL